MLVLLGHFFKIHLPWPCIFAVVMYKKNFLFSVGQATCWEDDGAACASCI